MSANGYVIVAYVVGLVLLWGYALLLWLAPRGIPVSGRAVESETGGRL